MPLEEFVARRICEAGGGDPERMCVGYIRSPASPDIQYDRKWFDPLKGRDRHEHKFWRVFGTEARAAIKAVAEYRSATAGDGLVGDGGKT